MKKIDNKGFSLLEILIAVAIGSVVLISAFAIFNYTSSSYSVTAQKMNAQEEAEYASNFIYEVLIEAEDAVVKNVSCPGAIGGGDGTVLVVSNNTYEVDPSDGKNKAHVKRNFFLFSEKSQKMYYLSFVDAEEDRTIDMSFINSQVSRMTSDSMLLAEKVSGFTATAPTNPKNVVLKSEPVSYTIEVSDGNDTFKISNEVYSRNTHYEPPATAAPSGAEGTP